MTLPAVSVVIPTYNRAADLRRCLAALTEQSFREFEVLVCDDGSNDDSAAVVAGYADRLDLVFDTAENFGGPARPRNRGIKRARAPYVAFLDSDDWWTPEKLEKSVAALEAGADVVAHDLLAVGSAEPGSPGRRLRARAPSPPAFESLLCTGVSLPNSSVVTRRALLERVGGVSEDRVLISVEDYDTWIRLARITERFVALPEILGFYWTGGANISAASPRQLERIAALYAPYLDELPESVRRIADGFLAYRLGRIAGSIGDRRSARRHLRNALVSGIAPEYRLKAAYYLLRTVI